MAEKKCAVAEDTAGEQVKRDIDSFDNEVQGAIASLIGYPTKKPQKLIALQIAAEEAEAVPNRAAIKTLERKLTRELKKHEVHTALYDKLRDYINESGFLRNYDMSPLDEIESWKIYLASRGYGNVSPTVIAQSRFMLNSISTRIGKIIDKRAKILSKGELNKREIAMFKPEVIGITADRFGIITKVIRKALRVTEDEINSYADYSTKLVEATGRFRNLLEDISLKTLAKVPLFTLNNASLWGLDGFETKGNEKVLIIGEEQSEETGGFDSYLVKRWNYEEEEWMPYDKATGFVRKDELKQGKDEVREALLRQYTDHFFNEVMNGTSRYVNLGVIPPRYGDMKELKNADYFGEDGFRTQWRGKDGEGGPLSNVLNEMALDSEFKIDNDGKRSTPGVHKASSVDGTAEYRYVLLFDKKESNTSGQKIFKAFLISKTTGQGKNKVVHNYLDSKKDGIGERHDGYDQSEWDNVADLNGKQMIDGWYRSQDEYNYGRMRNSKTGELMPGTNRKALRNFNLIDVQPPDQVFSYRPEEEAVEYNTFWDTLGIYDDVYKQVGSDAMAFTNKNNKRIKQFRESIEQRMLKLGKTPEEISERIQKLLSIGGMRSKVWMKDIKDANGNIIHTELRTPTSYFKLKSHGYFPHMFKKEVRFDMVNTEIGNTKEEIRIVKRKFGEESKEYKDILSALGFLESIRDRITDKISDNDMDSMTRLVEGEANVHMKHISSWTDGARIRTDGGVHAEYLKKIYSNLHRTSLASDVLESVDKLLDIEGTLVPEGTIDYLLNRVKMGVGDSDTRAIGFVTGRERGYQKEAERFNRLPEWVRGGVTFTASTAEKVIKWITSFPTQRYLGTSTAIGNLTQITNQIIANGWTTFRKAQRYLNDTTDTKWDRIIEKTGVLNQMSMFHDIMLQGGDVEWHDYGFVAGGLFGPIPGRNMVEWYRLLSKGRDSFIKDKDADLEAFLMKIEYRNRGIIGEKIQDLKELARKKRELNKKRDEIVAKKKGQMYDILTYQKGGRKGKKLGRELETTEQDISNMEDLMKSFVGDISDMKIKQMASWKLSWHLDITKGMRNFLTFSGTETNLRKVTAIMALLDAEAKGQLGGDIDTTGSKSVSGSAFTTPRAIKIARDAVYQSQFGMTPAYVGEGFNGLGRAIWQYKIYPTSQMEHDYNVLRRMAEGSDDPGGSIVRMTKALFFGDNSAIKRAYRREGYDPAADLDHEALAATRLIFSRFMASAVASMISVIPLISYMLRKSGSEGFSLLRSAENPAMGIAFRMVVWSSAIMMGADDDDNDKKLNQILQQFSFLFLPIWLGMVGRDIFTGYEFFDSD